MSDFEQLQSYVAMYPTEYLLDYAYGKGSDIREHQLLIDFVANDLYQAGWRIGLIRDRMDLEPSITAPLTATVIQAKRPYRGL